MSNVLQQIFDKDSFKIIQCSEILEDKMTENDVVEYIQNYHEGKTKHRRILESYQRLKESIIGRTCVMICRIVNCVKVARNPYQVPDKLTSDPKYPFDTIHLDILTLTKEKYLTIMDSFTRFATCTYLKTTPPIDIAECLIEYFAQYQVRNKIIIDNVVEFNNTVIKNLLNGFKIQIHITSVSIPQCNGIIYPFHSSLIEHLRLIKHSEPF